MAKYVKSYTFDECRQLFLKLAENGPRSLGLKLPSNVRALESWYERWVRGDSFCGASMAEFVGYLKHGYQIPGLTLEPELAPVRKRRKVKFNDMDGDYHHDLFLSGFDFYFTESTPREVTPSMDFEIDVVFAGNVDAKTVNAYTSWNLKALIALQTAGIGFDVWISNKVGNTFLTEKGVRFGDAELRIQVAKAGEATDLLDWSAIFAPGAYRVFLFFMKILHADAEGFAINPGFGSPIQAESYSVKFREEDRVIHSRIGKYGAFVESRMDEDFRLCLDLAKQ